MANCAGQLVHRQSPGKVGPEQRLCLTDDGGHAVAELLVPRGAQDGGEDFHRVGGDQLREARPVRPASVR